MASNEVKNLRDYLGDLRLSGAGHDQQNYLLERQWPEPLEPTAVQMGIGGEVTGLDCAVLVTRILLSYLEPAQRDPGLATGDIVVWLKTADLRSPILKWAWKNHPSLKGTDLLSEQRESDQRSFLQSVIDTQWVDDGNDDGAANQRRQVPPFEELMESPRSIYAFWARLAFYLMFPLSFQRPLGADHRPWEIVSGDDDTNDDMHDDMNDISDLIDDIAKQSLIHWSGSTRLEEHIRNSFEQVVYVLDPPQQRVTLCNWPLCLRVRYVPETPSTYGYEDLRSIKLLGPELDEDGDNLNLNLNGGPSQYNLVAVVRKLNNAEDVDSIRLYTGEGKHILKPKTCGERPYPYAENLNWKLGDFGAVYYMYYIKYDEDVDRTLPEDMSQDGTEIVTRGVVESIHTTRAEPLYRLRSLG